MKTRYFEAYRPLVLLGIGCVLSIAIIFWESYLLKGESLSLTLSDTESQEYDFEELSNEKSRLLPLQNYRALVSAPLFFEGREEVAATSDSNDDGSLKLTGIVLTPEGFLALVRDKEGAYYRLDKGNDVQGWTVASVQRDRVELVKNAESRELMLFEAGNRHDLTAKELEGCFKHQADLPLEECFKHPEKFAHRSQSGGTA